MRVLLVSRVRLNPYVALLAQGLEQNGAKVYRETFGKLDDPKIWAFNGHQRVPMERNTR